MTWLLLYAAGAVAFILWATRRLYVAWTNGHVKEVDDPEFGHDMRLIHRTDRPKRFWISVIITSALLVLLLVFLYFIFVELMSGMPGANVQ